jgi:TonB family protein
VSERKQHIAEETIQAYLEGKLNAKAANALERRALIDQELSDRLKGHAIIEELGIEKDQVRASLNSKLADRLNQQKKPRVLWLRSIGIAASIAIIGIVSWWMIDSIQKPDALAKSEVKTEESVLDEKDSENNVGLVQKEVESKSINPEKKPVPELVIAKSESVVEEEKVIIANDLNPVLPEAPATATIEQPRAILEQANQERESKALEKAKTTAIPSQVVRGKVVDELDDTLPGVTVNNKTNGTQRITDENGNFEIPINSYKDVLQMDYIGYGSGIVIADKAEEKNLILQPDENALSEIVITGMPKDQPAKPEKGWKVLNEERKINSEQSGVVKVSFEIDEQGHLNNIEITKSFDPARNAEVLEILKKYDQWNPEFANGKPVKSKKKLTFKFLKKKE